MFSRMDIPDPRQQRKPFRFRTRWIALFVLFDVAFVAIALWVVFGKPTADDRLVYLDADRLRLGGEEICPVILDIEDGHPGFPDSVRSGFDVRPLKARLGGRQDAKTAVFRFGAAPSVPFSMLETILTTLHSAGVAHLELVDSAGAAPVALREAEPICWEGGWMDDCSTLARFGNEMSFSWFVVRSDTLYFIASGKGGPFARSIPLARADKDTRGAENLRDSVRRWVSAVSPGDSLDSIGILLRPDDNFRRAFEVAALVNAASGRNPWLGMQPRGMDRFLSDLFEIVRIEESRRKDPSGTSRGLSLSGLERVFFREQGVGAFLATGAVRAGVWMPPRLDMPIVPPECDLDCQDLGSYSYRDFPLPVFGEGRRLLLREVQFRGVTRKTWPIWWALYDNGLRTSVWFFEGGLVEGKELTNYQIDRIAPLGPEGFRIQVRGELYRNGYWAEKGVELDFALSENGIALKTVGNRFSWLDGEEFRFAERFGDGWVVRTHRNPPEKLLRSCGYRNPRREGSPGFDWDRNLRITRCITRWPKADSSVLASGEKSFIER